MAMQTTKTSGSKPSFASIAAMAPPPRSVSRIVGSENDKPSKSSSPGGSSLDKTSTTDGPAASQPHRDLHTSMSRLGVKESLALSNVLNEQAETNFKPANPRLEDCQTHLSSSPTKAASLDGKSTTSGTTFALDEKESLRPDDSASVKAAEDEDFGSGPISGAPNSRVGSEAGGRAFRDQFSEISESFAAGPQRSHPLGPRIIGGIEEEGPQVTSSPLAATLPAPTHLPHPETAAVPPQLIDIANREPDEKLFEALESPKDRIFLLRLEQQIITFVQNSTESRLDLAPCNSFCRLLAHKLADYYALTHFVDNAVSSVTLFRTPFCRIPTPLSALAKTHSLVPGTGATAVQPAMKIMRRPGLGKDSPHTNSGAATTESSVAASKAGSETGDESHQGTGAASPADSGVAKEKGTMTRAEREARYREKREELFGPESENAESSEAVNEVSRTSSRNEEKKKKKKQKNSDDGFEARSQFNAYYPNAHFAAFPFDQTVNPTAYYSPYSSQAGIPSQAGTMGSSMLQPSFPQGYHAMSSGQGYTPVLNPNMYISSGTGPSDAQGYDQQTPTQYYSVMQPVPQMGQQSPAISSPAMNSTSQMPRPHSYMADQQWQTSCYPHPYMQSRDQQFLPSAAPSVPYPYGQLPYQAGVSGGKTAHPLPGSFNRQHQQFNPQTRAFVPNNGQMSSQNPPYSNNTNYPVNGSSLMGYANGQHFASHNAQAPSYPPVPSISMPEGYNPTHDSKIYSSRKSSAQTVAQQPNGSPVQSSLSKWGVPANLPPKPPPPEPSMSEHSLPTTSFNTNVQAPSSGQPMPNYHNGIYSMPGMGPQ